MVIFVLFLSTMSQYVCNVIASLSFIIPNVMKTTFALYQKTLKALLLLIFAGISYIPVSNASHIVGGEIYYQWISGNTYNVKLSLYRDCSGIIFGSSPILNYSSITCGLSGSFTVNLVSGPIQVSPICPSSLANSTCNGGTLFGVEQNNYEGVITLPGNCEDWTFSYNECCRNGAITNLWNGGGMGSYFSSMLNNFDVPFNNSVAFGNIPYSIININSTTQLSWNTYDVDGDSLIYELIPARDYNGTVINLNYAAGYSYNQPFLSSLPTTLNFTNGILEVTPNQNQVSVVCMRVSEYRNGFLIGEVNRDYQIVVISGTNQSPTLTGMNGTSNYVISGCPGDTIIFNVQGSDPDTGQIVSLSMNNIVPAAGLVSTPATNPVGTFSWIPGTNDISASAYTFIITAIDDNCNFYGTYSQAYQVYVNGCNTNDVWPGDANSDGTANLYDLLAIGIAYNNTGPIRPSASLTWAAQACPNWPTNFISSVNHKHADTDGNGVIDFSDTTAIFQNYGLNHPLRTVPPGTTTVADLTVTASTDTAGLSTAVNFDIEFATPVDSIYGLAFRLYFDPALIATSTISVSYPNSVFGTSGVDMLKLDHSAGMNGFVDIALTRINQGNITGTGPVARVTIVTTDNVSGKVVMNVLPFDIEAITLNESVVSLNPIGTQVVIDPNYVGINEITIEGAFEVYPVPARDELSWSFSGNDKIKFIRVYDVAGKEVMTFINPENKSKLNVRQLSKGSYSLEVETGKNIIHKKIMIF